MYIAAFNGSPRKNGNTFMLLRRCLDILEEEGIETKLFQVGGSGIRPCRACQACRRNNLERCVFTDDPLNEWLEEMKKADGILLGSPTYFWSVTPEMKALIDRAGFIARGSLRSGKTRCLFSNKVGAALSAYYRSGSIHALQAMQAFFLTTQMIVPGNVYWPQAQDASNGALPHGSDQDGDGLHYVDELGRSMAWLLKKLHA